jgi:hypothetical protein
MVFIKMQKQNLKLKLFFTVIMFGGFFALANSASAALSRSGRWLTYNGDHPYFVGYDLQQLFSQKSYTYGDLDYKLDQLQEFRINKIRVWADNWFMGTGGYYPWAVDIDGKKDLDQWDSAYWTRMRDFVQKCKDRDIIVEYTLFAPYPSEATSDSWWNNTTWKNGWNKSFNTNNSFTSNASGHFWPQFFDLGYAEESSSGKTLSDYQQALIDKSVLELNGFGNVYFEVANEFPGVWNGGNAIDQVYPWQQHWADYLHTTKGVITTCHANEGSGQNTWGIQYFKNQSYVDVLNFHFRTTGEDNVDQISAFYHELQATGKTLQCNESKAYEDPTYTDIDTREAWGSFVSGAYYFHYQDTPDIIGNSAWRTNAERLKVLRNIAETVAFWQMSPVDGSGDEYDSLISRGPGSYWQILADTGNEYVAYFSADPTNTTVEINLPAGNYNYKFYDTRVWNSNGVASGTVASTGSQVDIPAPSSSSWDGDTGLALVIQLDIRDTTSPYAPGGLQVR